MKSQYLIKLFLYLTVLFTALFTKAQNSDLDASFGTNGIVTFTTVTSNNLGHGGLKTILNGDNTLLMLGIKDQSASASDKMTFVSKLNFSGSRVSGFASNGSYEFGGYQQSKIPRMMAKLSTDEVVFASTDSYYLGGYYGEQTTYLQKISVNGAQVGFNVVPVYTGSGSPFTYFTFQSSCGTVVAATDGVLLGGKLKTKIPHASSLSEYASAPFVGFIASFNSSLNLISTGWGNAGVLTLAGVTEVIDMKLSGTNLFALALTSTTGSGRLYKISSTGALVPAFGSTGFINVSANSLSKIQIDGSGNAFLLYPSTKTVAKYNGTNGAIVTAWGSSGLAATTITGYSNASNVAIAIDNTSKLVVASRFGNNILVTRLNTSGQIDETFSGDGKGYSQGAEVVATEVNDVLTDANNDVYVTGKSVGGGHNASRAFVLKMKAEIPVTAISVSVSSLAGFAATYPTASSALTYSISGQFLSGNITITPSSRFELSLNGSSYSSSLTLVPSNGVINLTRIFVRIKSGATSGTFSESISHSSASATSKSIMVSGIISKSTATIAAINFSRNYQQANPEFTYTILGLKNGDNNSAINGTPTLSTSAIISSDAGAYTISNNISGVSATNYNLIATNGTLTINKILPTLNITSANSGTQGGSISLASTSNSGGAVTWSIVGGNGASLSGTLLNLTFTGNITVRASQASTTNYLATTKDQSISIVTTNTPNIVALDVVTTPSGFPVLDYPLSFSSNSPAPFQFQIISFTGDGFAISFDGKISAYAGQALVRIYQDASSPFTAGEKFVRVTFNKLSTTNSIVFSNTVPASLQGNNSFYCFDSFFASEFANLVVTSPNNQPRTYTVVSGNGFIAGTFNNRVFASVPGVVRIRATAPATSNVEALFIERDFIAYPLVASFGWSGQLNRTATYGDSPLDLTYAFKNPPYAPTTNSVIYQSPSNVASPTSDEKLTILKPGIVVIQGYASAGGIYNESYSSNVLTVNIAKRNLSVSGSNVSREYGESNPGNEIINYLNLLTGDDSKLNGSIVPVFSVSNSSNVSNTSYTLNTSGFSSEYYQLASNIGGTISITRAPLIIKPDDKFITYGQALPTFTYSITGFKLGQTASVITGIPIIGVSTISGAGVYPIQVTTTGLSATNYDFSSESGHLYIDKATLTITASNMSKVYGQANPTFTYSISGFVNGENASVITGVPTIITNAITGSSIGSYTISISGDALSANNYDFVFKNGTLNITKPNLTVIGGNFSRNYGSANPSFSASITGFLNGDNASVVTGSASFTTAANTSSNAGNYAITVSNGSLAATNYNFVFVNGQLTINKVALTAGVAPATKIYGNANPSFTATYTGFVNSETSSVISGTPSLTTTANATSTAGNYTITFGMGSLAATNYTFNVNNGTLAVTKAVLTVTAINASKVYGENNPSFTYSISGFKNGENASVLSGLPVLSTTANASSNAGTYPINLNLTGLSSTNYNFVGVNGTLTIGKATLTVSGGTYNRNYGEPNPTISASFSGFRNGENASIITGSASLSTTANASSNVGNYVVNTSIGTLSANNYSFSFLNGQLTVKRAVLIAGIIPSTKIYGHPNPSFTATYTGFVNGDNASVISGSPNLTTSANANSSVGNYTVNFGLGSLAATNYTFSGVNGNLSIIKSLLTITAINVSKVYGENNPSFTYSISGFKNGENESILSGTPVLSSGANASSNVGSYPIFVNINGLSATNYAFEGKSGVLTITKANRNISITSSNAGRNGTVITLTGTVSPSGTIVWSIQNGTGSAAVVNDQLTLNATGVVTVTAFISGDLNFNDASVSQLFTITNLTVPSITFGNISKTFTDVPFQLIASSNSPSPKVFTLLSSTPNNIVQISADGNVTILGAGTATIQVSQAEIGGFAATSQSAQINIAKKQVGIQLEVAQTGAIGSTITFSGTAIIGNPTIVWNLVNVTGSASISGNNLVLISAGIVELRAKINENANYLENEAFRVITITSLPTPNLSVSPIVKTFGDLPFNIAVQSNSNGAFTYSFLNSTPNGIISINNLGVTTILGAGTATFQVIQAAGNGYSSFTTTGSITINKAIPFIDFSTPLIDTVGNTFNIQRNNPNIVFALENGTGSAILNDNIVSLTGVGTISITGSLSETVNYKSISLAKTLTVIGKNLNTITGIHLDHEVINCYPNPVSSFLFIENLNTSNLCSISLTNSLGWERIIPYTKTENRTTIDLSNFPTGSYLLKLYFKDRFSIEKIVVTH